MKDIFRYVEIIKGGAHNRGFVTELPQGKTNLDLDYFSKEVVDGFHSLFMHTEAYKTFSDPEGRKRGYDGEVATNHFFWDIDNTDLSVARDDTILLVESLLAYHKENIRIYFSGNKGFHVIYFSPEIERLNSNVPMNVISKRVCTNIASGIRSFDSGIYDKTRIIRTPNSKHKETGLYKIELSYEELKLMNHTDIQNLARKQVKSRDFTPIIEIDNDFLELITEAASKEVDITVRESFLNTEDLLEGIRNGFKEGNRNSSYASYAGLLFSNGLSYDLVLSILDGHNSHNENPLPASEISAIVNSISRYHVSSGGDSGPIEAKDILTFRDAGTKWLENINRSGDFSLGERYPHINESMEVTLLGDLIGIVANSGVGKSSCGMDFANTYACLKGNYSLFLSLEMASHACFFRGATISHQADDYGEVSSKQVAYQLIHDEEVRNKVYGEWNRLLILDKGSISLNRIEEYVGIANQAYGGQVGSVFIDYAQYIDGAGDIDKAAGIARELKEIVKRLNVIGFVAMQCNKMMPNSYTEVEDLHIEGVKAWKQACDYIMAFWKSRDDDKRLHGKFLKTRWGKDDKRFDLVRCGLKYHSEDVLKEKPSGGL